MKLEWPIFTSTSPLLLLRPITMRFWRIIYSKSLPSKRAIAAPFGSGLHALREGLAGADFRASKAQASLSEGFCNVDILMFKHTKMAAWAKQNKVTSSLAVYILSIPVMLHAHVAVWRSTYRLPIEQELQFVRCQAISWSNADFSLIAAQVSRS